MSMTKRLNEGEALTPASLVPAGGDSASMDAWAAELVARAREEGVAHERLARRHQRVPLACRE